MEQPTVGLVVRVEHAERAGAAEDVADAVGVEDAVER